MIELTQELNPTTKSMKQFVEKLINKIVHTSRYDKQREKLKDPQHISHHCLNQMIDWQSQSIC